MSKCTRSNGVVALGDGRREITSVALLTLQVSHSIVDGPFEVRVGATPFTAVGSFEMAAGCIWPSLRCQISAEASSSLLG